MKRKYNTPYVELFEVLDDVITMSPQPGTIGGEGDTSGSGSYEDIMNGLLGN